MIELYEHNNFTYVRTANPESIWNLLHQTLTPNIEADETRPVTSFFNWDSGTFLRGFTPRVANVLWQNGFPVTWTKRQQVLRAPNFSPPVGELRHLQPWAVEEMAKYDYGTIDIATRFGKSYTYAGWYVKCGRPMTLVIVPRAAIAQQMQQELQEWLGEPVGLIAGSVNPIPNWQNFTVAIEQSICDETGIVRPEHVPYLHAVEARFRDECHIGGKLMDPVNMAMPNVIFSWAGSATPWPDDELKNWRIRGWYGDSRIRVSSKALADRGILSQVEAFFHFCAHEDGISQLDWTDLYKTSIVHNTYRNSLIAKIAKHEISRGRVGLIFVNHVAQAEAIQPNIPGSVIVASKLLSQKQSQEIKHQFNSGQVSCVLVTKKWREGVTLQADFGINAEGGKADHVVVQKLGRGLLPKQDGRAFRWHDFRDSGNGLLFRHSEARLETLLREEWPVRRFDDLEKFQRADCDAVFNALMQVNGEL